VSRRRVRLPPHSDALRRADPGILEGRILPLLHAESNLEDILQALVKVLERVPFAH